MAGRGRGGNSSLVVGLILLDGMMLPGNGVLTKPGPASLGTVNSGSLIAVLKLEKSPERKAGLGSDSTIVPAPEFCRVPCQLAKRNVLFFLIGPPSVPPY